MVQYFDKKHQNRTYRNHRFLSNCINLHQRATTRKNCLQKSDRHVDEDWRRCLDVDYSQRNLFTDRSTHLICIRGTILAFYWEKNGEEGGLLKRACTRVVTPQVTLNFLQRRQLFSTCSLADYDFKSFEYETHLMYIVQCKIFWVD